MSRSPRSASAARRNSRSTRPRRTAMVRLFAISRRHSEGTNAPCSATALKMRRIESVVSSSYIHASAAELSRTRLRAGLHRGRPSILPSRSGQASPPRRARGCAESQRRPRLVQASSRAGLERAGTIRATSLPCRVIVTSSPRSTRSSNWPSLFFASKAPTTFMGTLSWIKLA